MPSSAAENPSSESPPSRRRNRPPAVTVPTSETPSPSASEPPAAASTNDERVWRKFAKRLGEGEPKPLSRRLRRALGGDIPLLWGLPETPEYAAARALIRRLAKAQRQGMNKTTATRLRTMAGAWLEQEPLAADRPAWLLEALAWAHAAPGLAMHFEQTLWERLVDRCSSLVREAAGLHVEDDPWTHQLLAELGTTLAHQLGELPECAALAEPSREALSHGLCELTDGEGLLHARHLHLMRPLLACWTRAQLIGSAEALAREAHIQYAWFVEQAIRWTRRDGSELLATSFRPPWQPALFATALELADEASGRFLAATLLPQDAAWSEKGYRSVRKRKRPAVAHTSEWAAAAVLRSDWSRSSPQLAVKFPRREVALELDVGQRILLSGACTPEVKIAGRRLAVIDDWELICQFSDGDAEYAEVQADLEGGWRVQRQMLLGRTDGFLLLADAVLGPQPASIEYAARYPLGAHTTFQPAEQTHEGWLQQQDKPLALVMPLGLPEWREDRPVGKLHAADGNLVLEQSSQGRALFCPLFIDLERGRRKQEHTWRHLTVGANREIQPADVAVGYRVQIGKRQWLVYRSLTPRASRSVLGQHFIHEFVLGRFTPRGVLDELIQIE